MVVIRFAYRRVISQCCNRPTSQERSEAALALVGELNGMDCCQNARLLRIFGTIPVGMKGKRTNLNHGRRCWRRRRCPVMRLESYRFDLWRRACALWPRDVHKRMKSTRSRFLTLSSDTRHASGLFGAASQAGTLLIVFVVWACMGQLGPGQHASQKLSPQRHDKQAEAPRFGRWPKGCQRCSSTVVENTWKAFSSATWDNVHLDTGPAQYVRRGSIRHVS